MKEKIVYVTNEHNSAFELQEEFFQLGYEFFILTSIQIEAEENISFLNFFDVVILRESQNSWISQALIDKLNESAFPTVIMSPYEFNISHCEFIEATPYPFSHFKLHVAMYSLIHKNERQMKHLDETAAAEVFLDGELVKDVFRAFPKKISLAMQPVEKKTTVPKQIARKVAPKNFEILLSDKILYIDKQPIKLTKKERMLMDLLIKAKHQPVSNQYTYYQIWHQNYLPAHQPYIANVIKKIRLKVMHRFETELYIILNARKKGYYLNPKFKIINK